MMMVNTTIEDIGKPECARRFYYGDTPELSAAFVHFKCPWCSTAIRALHTLKPGGITPLNCACGALFTNCSHAYKLADPPQVQTKGETIMSDHTRYRVYADGEVVHQDDFREKDHDTPYCDDYAEFRLPQELITFIEESGEVV